MAFSFPNANWNPATTYAINNLVNYRGLDYISLQNANTNHDPLTGIAVWWNLYTDWLAGTTYGAGGTANSVTYQGIGYVSLAAGNLNHIPSSTTGVWWDRLVAKASFTPPATANDRVKFIPTGLVTTPSPRAGFAPLIMTASGQPFFGHVGLVMYRMPLASPPQSPGPASVWIGRVVFRVIRTGWYVGLGQRSNKSPISHNSGD